MTFKKKSCVQFYLKESTWEICVFKMVEKTGEKQGQYTKMALLMILQAKKMSADKVST